MRHGEQSARGFARDNSMTRRDWLLLAGLVALVLALALPTLTYPPGRDQGEFATIARGLLDGKTPYVDLWNPKPPAVFYVYALFIGAFGRTAEALRLVDFVVAPGVMAALYWLGLRLGNQRTAFFAALIFAAFYFSETFWTLSQNDGIALLPMALAAVCALKAADAPGTGRGAAWAFGAGALSAAALWFKYPFALFGAALALGYLLALPRAARTLPAAAGAALAFGAGGGLVVGAGVGYMASIGALAALIESARVTSQYTALTFNPADLAQLMGAALGFRWRHWGLLWLLAALWLVTGRADAARGRGWRLALLWALAGLLIMLAQAKGYDYHWLPLLPPLALLAADALDRLIALAARRGLAQRSETPAAALCALILLALLAVPLWARAWPYLTGAQDRLAYYSGFQGGEDFNAGESLAMANLLRERVVPGDSLYIWGFRPEVYYLSDLNPATRFIFQFPLVGAWYPPEWREENVETLWAALPPYTLVLQADYMPWVTGRNEDSYTLLQEYNALNDWLIFNYAPDARIGNFLIWRRKA